MFTQIINQIKLKVLTQRIKWADNGKLAINFTKFYYFSCASLWLFPLSVPFISSFKLQHYLLFIMSFFIYSLVVVIIPVLIESKINNFLQNDREQQNELKEQLFEKKIQIEKSILEERIKNSGGKKNTKASCTVKI